MTSTYAITGIEAGGGPNGQVPVRRDVDEWWLSQDVVDVNQKSLMIQAMTIFQNMDVNDKLSYFQIAGIHGQPLVPWDENTKSVSQGLGYCTHDSILFPSWHRPYMLLVEQRLHEIMINEIIPKFAQGDQADLKKAADLWRLPYWDWASAKPDWTDPDNKSKYGPNVPKLVTLKEVEVRTPTGTNNVFNPFWDFQMPLTNGRRPNMGQYGITEVNDEPFQDCVATSKIPPTDDPSSTLYVADWVDGGVQNTQAIRRNLRKEAGNNALPEAVYRLFTTDYLSTYDAFASTRYSPFPPIGQPPPSSTQYQSLEGIHNFIHTDTGGLGHMAVVPVAAFDPIFWLHHCNVDRLYAIWQALYPDQWFNPDPNLNRQRTDSGTWSNEEGMLDTPTTALTPFHRDANGTYWNSDDARDWTKQGYSYTELQPWLAKYQVNGKFDEATYQQDIRAQIDKLYGTTGRAFLKASAPTTASAASSVEKAVHTGSVAHNTSHPVPHHATDHAALRINPLASDKVKSPDVIVNVLYEKFALDGNPFTVHVFLGEPPAQAPYTFDSASNQVGNIYNFSVPSSLIGRDAGEGCANCKRQEQEKVKSTGQVVLTNALVQCVAGTHRCGAHLGSLGKQDVVEFLKKNLQWRVSTRDRDIPVGDIPSLKVSVALGSATHYEKDGRLSEYGNYEVLWDVTNGRPGGASQGDQI